MQPHQPRYWAYCPQCRVNPTPHWTCPRCGRSLVMTQAEEIAAAMAQMQPEEQAGGGFVGGCAGIIAAGLLLVIGLALLLFIWPLGLLYFGFLFVVALVRVVLRVGR